MRWWLRCGTWTRGSRFPRSRAMELPSIHRRWSPARINRCWPRCRACSVSPAPLLRHRFNERLNIAIRKRAPAVPPLGILKRLRHVVVDKKPIKADFVIDLHRAVHVHVSRIDELFAELRHRPGHIPEMYVQDLPA